MPTTTLSFDHVHLVSQDAHAAAKWYVDTLGGEVWKTMERHGAAQIYVSFGGTMIIVRGQRPGEQAQGKTGLEWGVDHFGLRVNGDFQSYCDDLKKRGIRFSMEPTRINPETRIAFIQAPDGVSVELLSRD